MAFQERYHDAPEVVPGGYGHDGSQVLYGEGLETAQPGKEVVHSPHIRRLRESASIMQVQAGQSLKRGYVASGKGRSGPC
jgi:hypothetical protein